MPSKFAALSIICICVALCATTTTGKPILDDIYRGLLRESQTRQLANEETPKDHNGIVKRRTYEDNPDSRLKQISLQSLIDDVEDSLFKTAFSVGSLAHNSDYQIPEIKSHALLGQTDPTTITDRSINKRNTGENSEKPIPLSATEKEQGTTPTSAPTPASPKIESSGNTALQTEEIYSQKSQLIPEKNDVPAHILIDRVTVQPHQGGLPIIPAFQVYHSKGVAPMNKEPNLNAPPTDIQTVATKTTTTPTTAQQQQLSKDIANETAKAPLVEGNQTTTTTTTTATTTTTTTTTAPSPTTTETTTKHPIERLKEAEEELKEKVAEIEAEPVILTARV